MQNSGFFGRTRGVIWNEVLQARQVEQVGRPEGVVELAVVLLHDLCLIVDVERVEVQLRPVSAFEPAPRDCRVAARRGHWLGSGIATVCIGQLTSSLD